MIKWVVFSAFDTETWRFMMKTIKYVSIFLIILHLNPVFAEQPHSTEIIIHGKNDNGSFDTSKTTVLEGPEYNITASYGEQCGSNLFHSFEQFNLQKNETATFSGPDAIQNIISRVTGGSSSWINGTIRSTIPNANMFLLNPSGVMFGPDAALDIGGSFHVSTADYITFLDANHFSANLSNDSILTTSAPSSFGFLDHENYSSITLEGHGDTNINKTGLHTQNGKTISFVGGDIEISKGDYVYETMIDDFYFPNHSKQRTGSLTSPEGRINLVSVASKGEVTFHDTGIDITNAQLGQIRIMDNAQIDVSGIGAGSIYARSENFILNNSRIQAVTTGNQNGGEISISVNKSIKLENGAQIFADTFGEGHGADINLFANDSVLMDGKNFYKDASFIRSNTGSPGRYLMKNNISPDLTGSDEQVIAKINQLDADYLTAIENIKLGNAGNITIKSLNNEAGKVNQIQLNNGASIVSITFGNGNAGNISLSGKQIKCGGSQNDSYIYHYYKKNLFFDDLYKERDENNGVIATVVEPRSNGGNGGNIEIHTDDMFLNDSFFVTTSTMGKGNSGDISIYATGNVELKGAIDVDIWETSIYTSSFAGINTSSGNAGNIYLEAKNLLLKDGSNLSGCAVPTYGNKSGNAGSIVVNVTGEIRLSGVNPFGCTHQFGSGNKYGSSFAAETTRDTSGTAGTIKVSAGNLILEDGGTIIAHTLGKSNGKHVEINVDGKIHITGSGMLKVDKGDYYVENLSGIYADSGSSNTDGGTSGDIALSANEVILSDKGTIRTSTAGGGQAGNIIINTNTLELYNNASICSSSMSEENGGAAGSISINAKNSVTMNNSMLTTDVVKNDPKNEHLNGKISFSTEDMHLINSRITTSVNNGAGDAGDINLSTSGALVLNKAQIIANAFEGTGGNIYIQAGQFIQSSDSVVDASSPEGGIDGTVTVKATDLNEDNSVTSLPVDFLDASNMLKPRCEDRTTANISRLILLGRDGCPTSRDDWLASPYHLSANGFDHPDIQQGIIDYHNGKFGQAIQLWESCLKLDNRDYLIDLFAAMVKAYQAIGHYQKATDLLQSVYMHIQKSSSAKDRAIFFSLLGDHSLCLRNTSLLPNHPELKKMKNAYEYQQKGLNEAQLSNNTDIFAKVMNNMGNVLASSGEFNLAIEYYDKSYRACHALKNNDEAIQLKVVTQINKSRAIIEKGTGHNFVKAIKTAILENNRLPLSYDRASNHISISYMIERYRNIISSDRQSSILKTLTCKELLSSIRMGKQLNNDAIISEAHGLIGQIYQSGHQFDEAIAHTRQAIFWAQYHPELLYTWQWQLGQLLNKTQNIEGAIEQYQSAIKTLNPSHSCDNNQPSERIQPPGVIHELFTGYRHQNNIFRDKVRPVYQELAQIYLDQSEQAVSNDKERFLRKVIDVMEQLKIAELQDYYEDECVTAVEESFETMDYPPMHTAVVYPIPLKESFVMILALPNRLISKTIHESPAQINQKAKQFREVLTLDSRHNPKRYQRLAKELYDLLIRPLAFSLTKEDIKTLVIVPDESLRLMPFSPLLDGNQYLIEKYAIVTIPAINLTDMKPCYKLNKINILLSGLSTGKPPLPFVYDELSGIKKIMGTGTLLLNEEFSTQNLYQQFQNNSFDMIVIATHGVFNRSSKESYLQTYDGKLMMDDFGSMIQSGLYRKQQIELISLSACDTAVGDERSALGLGGVALKAGARSAIATLWSVSDKATCLTTTEFYRQLKNKRESKAKALQSAQLKMISHDRYYHPGYWSPFLLIGNWL
jgi:filamentous hemagglutinin family protein